MIVKDFFKIMDKNVFSNNNVCKLHVNINGNDRHILSYNKNGLGIAMTVDIDTATNDIAEYTHDINHLEILNLRYCIKMQFLMK